MKRAKKKGLPPGSLIHIGEKKIEKVKMSVIDYDAGNFEERIVERVEDCFPFRYTPTVTWINIDGLHDIELIEKVGKHFNLHPLIMEDILNTEQRPKIEDFGDHVFIVLRMLSYNEKEKIIDSEQLSIVIGSNFVISFQEREGDYFGIIRDRIRKTGGKIRSQGSDYLAYSLTDTVVDNYFMVLEVIGGRIEELEEELIANPKPENLQPLHSLKRELLFMRKAIWPLREVLSSLERMDSEIIKESTLIYFRDIYDHVIQAIDTTETFREMLSGILEIYLSSTSNKLNEVMKVLTIIATIFIPLTFITSIYGMNFRHMPELDWEIGYYIVWAVLIATASTMIFYFRKKKWL